MRLQGRSETKISRGPLEDALSAAKAFMSIMLIEMIQKGKREPEV